VISPREAGNYEVVVSAEFDVQVVGVRVTNLLGLTAPQAKILSYIGYFLGPALSLPWWIEKWEENKRRKKAPAPQPVGPLTPGASPDAEREESPGDTPLTPGPSPIRGEGSESQPGPEDHGLGESSGKTGD
jgi:hypothetical protein